MGCVMYAQTVVWGMIRKNPPTVVVTVNVWVEVGSFVREKVLRVFAEMDSVCPIAGTIASVKNNANLRIHFDNSFDSLW